MCDFHSTGFYLLLELRILYNYKFSSMVSKLMRSIQFIFPITLVRILHCSLLTIIHGEYQLGYNVVKGSRLSVDELRAIFQGLMANDLFEYDYILTGYMGSGELLNVVAEYVRLIKSKFPHVKYRKFKFDRYFCIVRCLSFSL
jgi:hypothetical protein